MTRAERLLAAIYSQPRPNRECRVCDGSGRVYDSFSVDGHTICGACNGSGKQ